MSDLAKYILESYSDNNTSGLGSKFLEAASVKPVMEQEPDDMARSINYLNSLDEANDLLWIDFYSWNNLPLRFRQKVIEQMQVFEWSSAYMSFSAFEKIRDQFNTLDNYVVYVLKLDKYYRAIILGGFCDAVYTKDTDYLKVIDTQIKESTLYKFSTNKG